MDKVVRYVAMLGILALLGCVALYPDVAYAPAPRTILFALGSAGIAAFIATDVLSRASLKVTMKGVVFAGTGIAAVFFFLLLVMAWLAKPEQQVGIVEILDRNGKALNLEWDGAVQVLPSPTGYVSTWCVKGSLLFLIFPEQLVEQRIRVRQTSDSEQFSGVVTYAGSRTVALRVGTDLRTGGQ
jgi:hypothetical protein